MEPHAQRAALAALMDQQRRSFAELSRVIGRNPAYLQQYLKRGTPRVLAEADRAMLARYMGVPEAALGGRSAGNAIEVARIDVRASAGPGGLVEGEARRQPGMFPPA
ncbi:MAG: phage repressor protein, partial [Sphingomonadales bacterium]